MLLMILKKRKLRIALMLALFISGIADLIAQENTYYTPYLKVSSENMKKWDDRIFGRFMHWDMSSLLGVEISWAKQNRVDVAGEGEIPDGIYNNI